ncbi:MAG: ABC transporter permease [Pseudomonadota bacterium]
MSDTTPAAVGVAPPPRAIPWHALVVGAVALAVLAYLAVENPVFYRPGNLINVANQSAMLAILACGMTVVMLGGGIDLSLPANMALSGIVGSLVMVGTDSVALGCLVMVLTGAAVGALNGFAVARLRMIPFVVTLATLTVCGGFSVWVTGSVSISNQPERYFDAFYTRPLGLPLAVWVLLAVALAVQALTGLSRFGWQLYAVGTNPVASHIGRVPVRRVLFLSYVLAGVTAGVAAIVVTARLGSASANVGNDGVILDVVTACVIGGVSIYGGVGRPLGAVLGALFVLVLGNVLNLMGISFFIGLMLKGAIIVAVVALDRAFGRAA